MRHGSSFESFLMQRVMPERSSAVAELLLKERGFCHPSDRQGERERERESRRYQISITSSVEKAAGRLTYFTRTALIDQRGAGRASERGLPSKVSNNQD